MAIPAAATLSVKTCSRCGDQKPLDEFCRDKRNPDGRGGACLVCERTRAARVRATPERQEYMRAYGRRDRKRRPEHHRARARRLYRADPEKGRRRRRRWTAKHRDLVNERAREAYLRAWADPEKRARILERNARRRHAIEAASSPELVAAMVEMYALPCTYCGATEDIEIDHIYPLARGGKHERRNLTPACGFCNRSKKDRLLSEWLGVVV